MPAPEVNRWLASGEYCRVDGLELRPKPHPYAASDPLSIPRGQAEAFCMVAHDRSEWIIKKFHNGKAPDGSYLQAVSRHLPQLPGFIAGWRRRILPGIDRGSTYSAVDLAQWLSGTVLMPKIDGVDWASVADDLRGGDATLSAAQRALLCRSLARAIDELERADCAHRDLSTGNVYIDGRILEVGLIDWDSLYHPALTMPPNTTGGSDGYVAPFVWRNGAVVGTRTWVKQADRFALAVCCSEFLVMEPGTPFCSEGGMFEQSELCRGSGRTVVAAMQALRSRFPEAAKLLERALAAQGFADCPSPAEWIELGTSIVGDRVKIGALPPAFSDDELLVRLAQRAAPPPVWAVPPLPPAPAIAALPTPAAPTPAHPVPPLPPVADFQLDPRRAPPTSGIMPSLPPEPFSKK